MAGATEVQTFDWIQTRTVSDSTLVEALSAELDIGEAEAIALVVCGLNKPGIQNLFVRFGARRAMPLHIRVSENVGVWLAEP